MRRVGLERNAVKDKFGVGKHGFGPGNPQSGNPATTPGYEWFDAIQEEMAGVVESAGLALDNTKRNQLSLAIQRLFAPIENPVFSGAIKTQINEGGASSYNMVAEFSGSGIQNVSIGGGYRFYYRSGAGSSTRGGGVLAIRSFDFNNGESDNLLTIDGNGTVTIAAALSVPAGTLPSNPIVNSQIATSLSDPAGNLNTANPASTSWVRGAMSSIATAAGFSTSLGANGYIKFPSWLGGLVVQWGAISVTTTITNYNFPTAFPNGCFAVLGTPTPQSPQNMGFSPVSKTQFSAATTQYNPGAYYIALGY